MAGVSLESDVRAIAIPRAPGTQGHRRVREYIVSSLRSCGGLDVRTQFVRVRRKNGEILEFRNVVATTLGKRKPCIVLAAHYDSKTGYTGASDAATSCAILLWLARNLRTKGSHEIRFVFFDGEEALGKEPWTRRNTLWGSRALAWAWSQTGEINDIGLFVLLDLVGSKGTGTAFYSFWKRTAMHLKRLSVFDPDQDKPTPIFRVGEKPPVGSIEDDHLPFLQRNVPVLHLISLPFPDTWHTDRDTPDSIDYAILRRVALSLRAFCEERDSSLLQKLKSGIRFADPQDTIIIALPHAIESDTGPLAALCLSRNLGRRAVLMDNWKTPRSECDVNQTQCRHKTSYRQHLRRMVRSVDASFVIVVHSAPSPSILDRELGVIENRATTYGFEFVVAMDRKRINVGWFRGTDNDIQTEMRDVFSRRSFSLAFNESMASDRLEFVCRQVSDWLRTA